MSDSTFEDYVSQSSVYNPNNEYTSLQLRLDTDRLLTQIENTLRGTQEVIIETKDGNVYQSREVKGVPIMNELGIQKVMGWLRLTFSSHIVQGNFFADKTGYSISLENWLCDFRKDLTDHVIINCYDYEIPDNELMGLIDMICDTLKPFMSRTINNEERLSYSKTMVRHENTSTQSKNKGFKLFKSGE